MRIHLDFCWDFPKEPLGLIKKSLSPKHQIFTESDFDFKYDYDLKYSSDNKKKKYKEIVKKIDIAIFILSEENIDRFFQIMLFFLNKKPIFVYIYKWEGLSENMFTFQKKMNFNNFFQMEHCNDCSIEFVVEKIRAFMREVIERRSFFSEPKINYSFKMSSEMDNFVKQAISKKKISKADYFRYLAFEDFKKNKSTLRKWEKMKKKEEE